MAVVDHWTEPARTVRSVPAYVDLQLSHAHIAALTPDQRTTLGESIRAIAGDHGRRSQISLTIWQYTCASQPLRH
jgi:hypothetical protein